MGYNSLLEIVTVFSVIGVFLEWLFGMDLFDKIGLSVKEAELNTSEDLGNFSESLTLSQSAEIVKEA